MTENIIDFHNIEKIANGNPDLVFAHLRLVFEQRKIAAQWILKTGITPNVVEYINQRNDIIKEHFCLKDI